MVVAAQPRRAAADDRERRLRDRGGDRRLLRPDRRRPPTRAAALAAAPPAHRRRAARRSSSRSRASRTSRSARVSRRPDRRGARPRLVPHHRPRPGRRDPAAPSTSPLAPRVLPRGLDGLRALDVGRSTASGRSRLPRGGADVVATDLERYDAAAVAPAQRPGGSRPPRPATSAGRAVRARARPLGSRVERVVSEPRPYWSRDGSAARRRRVVGDLLLAPARPCRRPRAGAARASARRPCSASSSERPADPPLPRGSACAVLAAAPPAPFCAEPDPRGPTRRAHRAAPRRAGTDRKLRPSAPGDVAFRLDAAARGKPRGLSEERALCARAAFFSSRGRVPSAI